MKLSRLLTFCAFAAAVPLGGVAYAQSYPNCQFGPYFDACMQQFVAQQQNRIAQSQQQLFQIYLSQNQDWLARNYAAHRAAGGQMTYLQFAQWGMMTANGTNTEGALQAQRDQFNGSQQANRTIQEGNRDYNAGAAANSAATSETARRYDQGAVRGNAPYVDPESGQTTWLPYAPQPDQPFRYGGQEYVQNRQGVYFQRSGSDWVRMDPNW